MQKKINECGYACLYIISKYFSKQITIDFIKHLCPITAKGVSIYNLCETAKHIDFIPLAVKISINELKKIRMPFIVLFNKQHYVVVFKIINNKIYISDPAQGITIYTKKQFTQKWYIDGKISKGIAIVLEPNN